MYTVLRMPGYQWINISKLNHKKSNTNKRNKTWNIWKRSNPWLCSAGSCGSSLSDFRSSSQMHNRPRKQEPIATNGMELDNLCSASSGQANRSPEVAATERVLPTCKMTRHNRLTEEALVYNHKHSNMLLYMSDYVQIQAVAIKLSSLSLSVSVCSSRHTSRRLHTTQNLNT